MSAESTHRPERRPEGGCRDGRWQVGRGPTKNRRPAATLMIVLVVLGVVAMMCAQAAQSISLLHRSTSNQLRIGQARELVHLATMDLRQHGRPVGMRRLNVVLPDGTMGHIEIASAVGSDRLRVRAWLGEGGSGTVEISDVLVTGEGGGAP